MLFIDPDFRDRTGFGNGDGGGEIHYDVVDVDVVDVTWHLKPWNFTE